MRTLSLFMNVSLDGYFEGMDHDISGFNNDFEGSEQSTDVDTILLGRKTFELMKSFWSMPQAEKLAPQIAKFMNETLKVVASHKSFDPGWNNVTVFSENVAMAVKQLKEQPGKNIIIFGSNNLCVSLMQEGLIDEFQIVVNPIALGEGTTLFKGLPKKATFALIDERKFRSGAILLTYELVSG